MLEDFFCKLAVTGHFFLNYNSPPTLSAVSRRAIEKIGPIIELF
jgi:hypothetical protein